MTQSAIFSGFISLAVALLTSVTTAKLQAARLRAELKTEYMAEEAIAKLLDHERWELRSFDKIRRHIGGFEDEELRRLLVRAGAVRFANGEGEEMWGLRRKNEDRLA